MSIRALLDIKTASLQIKYRSKLATWMDIEILKFVSQIINGKVVKLFNTLISQACRFFVLSKNIPNPATLADILDKYIPKLLISDKSTDNINCVDSLI